MVLQEDLLLHPPLQIELIIATVLAPPQQCGLTQQKRLLL